MIMCTYINTCKCISENFLKYCVLYYIYKVLFYTCIFLFMI